MFTTLSASVAAFVATNLDDLLMLTVYFAQSRLLSRRTVWAIVLGQYLGFGLLLLASLPGFLGGLLVPRSWIGLLGIVPMILGLSRLFEPAESNDGAEQALDAQGASWLSPQTYAVAALTVANGSDNIGVYGSLFANCTGVGLGLTLAVFLVLLGLWCYWAYRLTQLPPAAGLAQSVNQLVPYLLLGLGTLILWNSQTLADRGLTLVALLICAGYLLRLSRPEVEP